MLGIDKDDRYVTLDNLLVDFQLEGFSDNKIHNKIENQSHEVWYLYNYDLGSILRNESSSTLLCL